MNPSPLCLDQCVEIWLAVGANARLCVIGWAWPMGILTCLNQSDDIYRERTSTGRDGAICKYTHKHSRLIAALHLLWIPCQGPPVQTDIPGWGRFICGQLNCPCKHIVGLEAPPLFWQGTDYLSTEQKNTGSQENRSCLQTYGIDYIAHFTQSSL